MTTEVRTFGELCAAADRRALRVLLRASTSAPHRLTRLALADRDGVEVAATRLGRAGDALDRGATALLEYLDELDRRAA